MVAVPIPVPIPIHYDVEGAFRGSLDELLDDARTILKQ